MLLKNQENFFEIYASSIIFIAFASLKQYWNHERVNCLYIQLYHQIKFHEIPFR